MIHCGQLWYAVCDAPTDTGRCPEFLVPPISADPAGPGTVFAGQYHVHAALRDAGWQVVRGEHRDGALCPAHRPKESPTQVVDVCASLQPVSDLPDAT